MMPSERHLKEQVIQKQNKINACGEKMTALISKEDTTQAEVVETGKENGTATASKARSLKLSLRTLNASSKNGDWLSSKKLELKKMVAQENVFLRRMEQNLQPEMTAMHFAI
ncbi:hypothetical protein QUC31_007940 [Theobroma cacao]